MNMKYLIVGFLFLIITPKQTFGQISKAKLDSVIKSKIMIWNYLEKNIDIPNGNYFYNPNNKIVSKEVFLNLLSSGNYLPQKIKNDSRKIGLLNLNNKQNSKEIKGLKEYLKGFAEIEAGHFLWENQDFPEFNFTDINGSVFTNSTLRGKKILLKCWFINCTACVAEFPEVNKIVEKYTDRNDIEYLSLAFEDNEPLRKFLLSRPLNYKVIGNQKGYIMDTLKLNTMPTHFLINENGKIVKVTNYVNSIKTSIKDLVGY